MEYILFLKGDCMYINNSNRNLLDSINVHDSVFDGFEYLYSERQIRFNCNYSINKKSYSFIFNNVIYFNVQSCWFWGAGPNILCFNVADDSSHIEELTKLKKDWHGFLNDDVSYLQIEFQLNSGDTIFIMCESIDINEYDMAETL